MIGALIELACIRKQHTLTKKACLEKESPNFDVTCFVIRGAPCLFRALVFVISC
jgi:hypothetical protein